MTRFKSWLTITANILLTSHLLFAVVIIQNPVAQLVESFFNIEEMGIKRVLVRASISTTGEFTFSTSLMKFLNFVVLQCLKNDDLDLFSRYYRGQVEIFLSRNLGNRHAGNYLGLEINPKPK